MNEFAVRIDEDLEIELFEDFARGVIEEFSAKGELRRVRKVHVDYLRGAKVEIFSNEHPPPHFRIKYQGSTANYSIKDCSRLNGGGEVIRFEKNTYKWWKKNKQKLIDIWNERRPSDCPVGEYREEIME